MNAPQEKIIRYKILPSDGLEKSAGKEDTAVIDLTPKSIRGLLDKIVIGECKFNWYPRLDVLNVGSADPNLSKDGFCQLSPRTYLKIQENYWAGGKVQFNGSGVQLRFEKDGPHLYETFTRNYQIDDVVKVVPDSAVPALGEAYLDTFGLIWGSPVVDARGEVQLMSYADAVRYCGRIGARLPKMTDYLSLIRSSRGKNSLYFLPGTKTELIPGISQVQTWAADKDCILADRKTNTCSSTSTYSYFKPNPGGEYYDRSTTNPDDPKNYQAVRCVAPGDPFRQND